MARGLRNSEIAQQLFLSQNTVKHHMTALLSKFHVANRASLISRAMSAGTISVAAFPGKAL